ncbi:MAG TPA: FkbM family methyltransferase, partial [Mucilaginibacter sp.]|nr:FkbM family methyltransferase [Mucilaginibacter sp.]
MKLKDFFKNKSKKRNGPKQVQVGNFSLTADADHLIEEYLKNHKYYSRNLPRIAKYLEAKYPIYGIVDVGANIGDTAALLRTANVNQTIYAIEGEPTFFKLLQKNLPQFKDVIAFETFLGENNHIVAIATEVHKGTARLNRESERNITVKKLDDFAAEENLKNVKLLKIDTDGYDLKILRGSSNFIKVNKPVIFFEYDAAYLEEQGEDGIAIFEQIRAKGYNKLIYYDNYGKLMLSTTTDNKLLIEQLYAYMRKKEGAFPYYDVCIF